MRQLVHGHGGPGRPGGVEELRPHLVVATEVVHVDQVRRSPAPGRTARRRRTRSRSRMFSITARVCARMSRSVVPNSSTDTPAKVLSGRRDDVPETKTNPPATFTCGKATARHGPPGHHPSPVSHDEARRDAVPSFSTTTRTCAPGRSGTAAVAAPARNTQPSRSPDPVPPGQPDSLVQRPARVAEDGRGRADLRHPPVDLQQHAEVVQPVRHRRPGSDHERGGRGVVGDHVRQREGEVGVPGVDQLDRRGDGAYRVGEVADRFAGLGEPVQQERHLRLDPGVDEVGRVDACRRRAPASRR